MAARQILDMLRARNPQAADIADPSEDDGLDERPASLDIAAVRAAAEPRATSSSWATDWERMIATARGEGRLSADGAGLEVPVESAAGA